MDLRRLAGLRESSETVERCGKVKSPTRKTDVWGTPNLEGFGKGRRGVFLGRNSGAGGLRVSQPATGAGAQAVFASSVFIRSRIM
jgi:hypothetical protein